MSYSDHEIRLIVKELRIGNEVDHPHVMRILAYSDEPLVIYMDYMAFDWKTYNYNHQSHNLCNFLEKAHAKKAVKPFHKRKIFETVLSDITLGIEYLHAKQIAHRDLKPYNILVSNDPEHLSQDTENNPQIFCKIADFGESRSYFAATSANMSTHTNKLDRGTTPFMAPEVLVSNYKQDIQVLKMTGMLLFCLLNPNLKHPFCVEYTEAVEKGSRGGESVLKEIIRNSFAQGSYQPRAPEDPYTCFEDTLHFAYCIMRTCLVPKPEDRPTAHELLKW